MYSVVSVVLYGSLSGHRTDHSAHTINNKVKTPPQGAVYSSLSIVSKPANSSSASGDGVH